MAVIDRSQQTLVLYKKDGTKVATGTKEQSVVTLTGLNQGTVVSTGEYQVSYITDGGNESSKVDVPAFTIPVSSPTSVAAVPTSDGAKITAK